MSEEEVIVDLEEINERYEEKRFFERLVLMVGGLGKPHNTREYKIARTELQRMMAPLIAIGSVILFVIVLIVMTAVSGQKKEVIEVQIAEVEKEEEIKEEEPPPPDDIEPPPEDIEIEIDTPNPGPVSDITPMPSPPSQQVTVKPAPQDSVAFVDSPVKMKSMTGSRTPGSIGAATRGGAGYGDAATEACVMKVLWFLKGSQESDGGWKRQHSDYERSNRVGDAALATLTFLAHGEYPGSPSPYQKDFGPVVQKAIGFIISQMDESKENLRFKAIDAHEYAFMIATYALCEAYGMTKNPNCKEAAMKCLARIIDGQTVNGGWDYNFKKSDSEDVSLGGWALQALKAGKMAGLKPEGMDEAIKKAVKCLQTRNFKSATGEFKYRPAGGHTYPGLTATGCLALQLLGYGNKQEVAAALNFMRDWSPAFDPAQLAGGKRMGANPQYNCYYATQCKYQAGMKAGATKEDERTWQEWNQKMKKLYTTSIIDLPTKVKDWSGKEHKQGHFKNKDNYSTPILDSCYAALQLMVYYRYLPTTQTAAGKADEDEGSSAATDASSDVSVEVDI